MKKQLLTSFFLFLLAGCGSSYEYVHSKEPRSTVYYGQPVADLYENFGTPTKATRISDNERILFYISQEIEKDWAYRYVRGCVMKFHLLNERVINWTADGQACVIQTQRAQDMPDAAQLMQDNLGLLDSSASTADLDAIGVQSFENAVSPMSGVDNFNGSKIKTMNAIDSRGKASDLMGISGQLPADAFDGKASTTYNTSALSGVSQQANNVSVPMNRVNNQTPAYNTGAAIQNSSGYNGMQLPADAFGGKASTVYTPQTGQRSVAPINQSTNTQLPADAFGGKASTSYTPQIGQRVAAPTSQAQNTQVSQNAFSKQNVAPAVQSKPVQNMTEASLLDGDEDWGLFD